MRSRYSAYANCLADYIIRTTDPASPLFQSDKKKWGKEIVDFCMHTLFKGLVIDQFIDGDDEASVTFTVHLEQSGNNATFTEQSSFKKIKGRWYYSP